MIFQFYGSKITKKIVTLQQSLEKNYKNADDAPQSALSGAFFSLFFALYQLSTINYQLSTEIPYG